MIPKIELKQKNPDAVSKIYERLANSTKKVVAVGFPRGAAAAYPDGTEVATVAAAHVYGMGVPTRDFMELARPEIMKRTKDALNAIKKGGLSSEQMNLALNVAGQEAQAAIKEAITDLSDPPNAESTLHPDVGGTNPKGKKSTNPLIDTEHMRDSVSYVIRNKGGA